MRYTLRKISTTLATLAAVSFFTFLAFHLIAGDPATTLLGTEATPERVAALRSEMGLDAPLLLRYLRWLAAFVSGDMGQSHSYNIPVHTLIGDKIPITLTLTALAFVMIVALAVPLGIHAARRVGRPADRAIMAAGQIIMAVPPFFAGILLTLVFGLVLRFFTPGAYISYKENGAGFLAYLIWPALAIALPKAAMAAKLLRGSLISELGQDYVRTAYGKGLSSRQVLYRHVLRNAIIPLITFLGMALAEMLVGSIIIEQVFGIPGMGRILLNAIGGRDYPVVMAVITCFAFFVLMANMIVDLGYGLADPRIGAVSRWEEP